MTDPVLAAVRPLRVLLVHPGASWSTADVFAGLDFGLQSHGIQVMPYRLDQRITWAHKWLHQMWRFKKKRTKDLPKPAPQDVIYQAGCDALNIALRHSVDVVIVVSCMFMHPDVLVMMKRAGLKVCVLFTESPYDEEQEMRIAGLMDGHTRVIDGCWTNERVSVPKFKEVNPNVGYLQHAFHPEKHFVSARQIGELPSHDVVFVGSGFNERIHFFNSIDWTGIDLGLYGTWQNLGLNKQVKACIKGGNVSNEHAASLYRRAKIGLNLYRTSKGWGKRAPSIVHAESLSPRAYELAACGSFHLSEYRAEVPEVFGDLVPTFTSPSEAEALIRTWLNKPDERAAVSRQLPACVAEHSWHQRATTVIGDLHRLLMMEPHTGAEAWPSTQEERVLSISAPPELAPQPTLSS